MIIEVIIGLVIFAEFLITMFFGFYIALRADSEYKNEKYPVVSALVDFIKNIFIDKNWFGIILSSIVLISIVPAILLLLLMAILMYSVYLFTLIWDLGNKK